MKLGCHRKSSRDFAVAEGALACRGVAVARNRELNDGRPMSAGQDAAAPRQAGMPDATTRGFTLIEMITVLALAVIIAAIILPSLRGFGEANTMGAGTRQMLDDVAYARQMAIKNHTKVYMVFVSPEFWTNLSNPNLSGFTAQSKEQAELLIKQQYTSYALFSFRSVGDQLGQPSPRYLTKWRELPDGIIIETNKFTGVETVTDVIDPTRVFEVRKFSYRRFPFPSTELTNAAPKTALLPYIAFDSTGALSTDAPNGVDVPSDALSTLPTEDEFIPLAHGSIFYPKDATGKPNKDGSGIPLPPDVVETGYREATRINYNIIRIDRLTGRPKLEQPELK